MEIEVKSELGKRAPDLVLKLIGWGAAAHLVLAGWLVGGVKIGFGVNTRLDFTTAMFLFVYAVGVGLWVAVFRAVLTAGHTSGTIEEDFGKLLVRVNWAIHLLGAFLVIGASVDDLFVSKPG